MVEGVRTRRKTQSKWGGGTKGTLPEGRKDRGSGLHPHRAHGAKKKRAENHRRDFTSLPKDVSSDSGTDYCRGRIYFGMGARNAWKVGRVCANDIHHHQEKKKKKKKRGVNGDHFWV